MGIINILASVDTCDVNSIKRVFSLLGNLFNIIKFIIPIIIIIVGTIDLVKAMIANSPEESKKAQTIFIKRVIIAVCVFFVFPIVSFLMGLLGQSMDNQCIKCFSHPNEKQYCYFTTTTNKSSSSNTNQNSNNNEIENFELEEVHENVSTSGSR